MKYIKIKSIEQYNEYCDKLEELLLSGDAEIIDEIELLEILIQNYDQRIQDQTIAELDPVGLLKSLLEDFDLSQSEFARKIVVSRQIISDILNYRRRISKDLVIKFAEFFSMQQEAFSRPYELNISEANKPLKRQQIESHVLVKLAKRKLASKMINKSGKVRAAVKKAASAPKRAKQRKKTF